MDMVHTIWLLCCLHVQSPGSLIATDGRWLTGCDVDACTDVAEKPVVWSRTAVSNISLHGATATSICSGT